MNFKPVEGIYNTVFYETTDTPETQVSSNVGWCIGEEYMNGRTNIHIHIRFDTEEYCAIFDRDCDIFNLYSIGSRPFHIDFLTKAASGKQKVAMFIGVTEDLEIPEILVPCVVTRLQRIYDGHYCVRHPLELAPLYSFVFTDAVKDGELGPACRFVPFGADELIDEMVEGASEIIEHFPKPQSDIVREGGYILEAIECISHVCILLFCDTIYVRISKGKQLSAQSFALFSGPVQFGRRTFKGGHYEKISSNTKDSKGARDTYSQIFLILLTIPTILPLHQFLTTSSVGV